jgi:hypothetical protein
MMHNGEGPGYQAVALPMRGDALDPIRDAPTDTLLFFGRVLAP